MKVTFSSLRGREKFKEEKKKEKRRKMNKIKKLERGGSQIEIERSIVRSKRKCSNFPLNFININ